VRLYRLLLLVLAIVLVSTVGAAASRGSPQRNFRAHLAAEDAGTQTRAQGQAVFQFNRDGSEVRFKLIVSNIENVTMAHIHVASAPGANGPPAVWLYPSAPPAQLIPGRFDGVLAQGKFTAAVLVGSLAGMTLEDLRTAIQEGRAYVNVHTSQYPAGEIRGQIH
jgi:hypothetical protein